jgi:hypothetical protein
MPFAFGWQKLCRVVSVPLFVILNTVPTPGLPPRFGLSIETSVEALNKRSVGVSAVGRIKSNKVSGSQVLLTIAWCKSARPSERALHHETLTGVGTLFRDRSSRYLGKASFQEGIDTPTLRSLAFESTEFAGRFTGLANSEELTGDRFAFSPARSKM